MNVYKSKKIIKQCFIEFFGTGLIVFFGTGCLAASKLTNVHFDQFEISFIWGLATSISIYFSFSISGAHLNPAITIFFYLFFQFNKKKVFPYIISQIFGSFFFTMIVYYFYYDLLIFFEKNNNIIKGTPESFNLASIFCVYPNCNNSFVNDLLIEIFSATIFIIIILQFNYKKNNQFLYKRSVFPILVGLLIFMINLTIGPINSISLNPARDLGPKIFLSLTGWGIFSFTGGNDNFLYSFIPVIGPILGFCLGGFIHKILFSEYFYFLRKYKKK